MALRSDIYRIADNKIDIVRVPPLPISSTLIEIRSSRIANCSLNSDEKSGLAESGGFAFIWCLNYRVNCLYIMFSTSISSVLDAI